MFSIAKEFDFCYGHRVFTQELDTELSCNMSCKCRHLHGHHGIIIVLLEGEEVDHRGMVIDFNELTWFKKWVDDVLDHKMILSLDDPILPISYPLLQHNDLVFNLAGPKYDLYPEGYFTINPEYYKDLSLPEKELYEGLVLVPFVPTSENLSKWLWEIVNNKIGHLCKVSRVQFFETPKSQSNYIN